MRRAIPLLACCATLAAAAPSGAALVPVRRTVDGRTLPRVRAGTIPAPRRGPPRVRVIAELALPPLAARYGRGLYAVPRRKLAVASTASRAYLARLAATQARAVTELHRAIPQARVQERFRIVLDAITVDLPAKTLPTLMRQTDVTRVYPSLRYTLAGDSSPSAIIGADTVRQALGADGTGMKIAIVDDGIDQTNPFFDPKGFSYPPGYPKGAPKWTTPKVIVARVFPGPGSGRAGRLAVDPNSSFHGTHVAGIAAGDAGTTAPAGGDHPEVTNLTGVAPRAWLGNYRVFTVPTPIGHVANTPEIIAAFEAAVADGMDVINFSGGGPQTDPANDALVEAVHNVAAAGVVPVIAAGNDRDDFGNGSVGSPGTAPDAISVAAVTSNQVFAPALGVVAPGAPAAVTGIPYQGAAGSSAPEAWTTSDQTLVDVGSIVGTDGKPVSRLLCGPPGNLASTEGTLPAHSLDGTIALAQRGICPFVTKALQAKAAGAIGIVLADNRAGEATQIPLALALPAGMVSDLDGAHLRAFMATTGGRTQIRVGQQVQELQTGRGGVIANFSSSGPTPFGHDLKPDVAAPGAQILSSTLPSTNLTGFAVFDGTSMATPHVSGAAALLLQLHPWWTPAQVKSALVATAAPAWADTARTQEAPVPLEGGGLVSLPGAESPLVFTDPASLSFENLDVSDGAAARGLLVRLTDAGGGAGTWQVSLEAQAATAGTSVDVGGPVSLAPGGEVDVPVVAHAAADATPGENYGFVVFRRGTVTRRVPYFVLVERPALATAPLLRLERRVSGDTRTGPNRVSAYAFPTAPFGNAPDTPPMVEAGGEILYWTELDTPAANIGVSLEQVSPGAQIDPFFLGARDESSVQGFAGTPVDVNALTSDYLFRIGAAGASFPRQGRYYVAVDSGLDQFTGASRAGRFVLRSWVNDVTPPSLRPLTLRVSAGRPTLVLRALDSQSGVDPLSLTIGLKGMLVGAASYDPISGVAVFPLPQGIPALAAGTLELRLTASDYEEAKNVNTSGTAIMPNTRTVNVRIRVVSGPAVDWTDPAGTACLAGTQRLRVAASSSRGVRRVRFLVDGRQVAVAAKGSLGLWAAAWRTARASKGRHVLEAVAVDGAGRSASARRIVRVCR